MSLLDARTKAAIVKSNPDMGVYLILQKLEKEFEAKHIQLKKDFDEKLQEMSDEVLKTLQTVRQIQKGDKPVVGIDFNQPRDGHTPTREELLALINPLIPKVKDGHTPTTKELRNLIIPLIPEQQDAEAIAGLVLSKLKQPDVPTADAIAEMVLAKIATSKISINNIENLENSLTSLRKSIQSIKSKSSKSAGGGGGGMGNVQNQYFTINAGTTTITTTYPIAGAGSAIFNFVIDNADIELTNHYTVGVDRKTITFDANLQTQFTNGMRAHICYIRG